MEELVQAMKPEQTAPKRISIMVPTYNEEENVVPLSEALTKIFREQLSSYDYHITFIDNCRPKIRVDVPERMKFSFSTAAVWLKISSCLLIQGSF